MADVIDFPERPRPLLAERSSEYWGLCPVCRRAGIWADDGGRQHWFVCADHRVKWCIGENLFSRPDDWTYDRTHHGSVAYFLTLCREVELLRCVPLEGRCARCGKVAGSLEPMLSLGRPFRWCVEPDGGAA